MVSFLLTPGNGLVSDSMALRAAGQVTDTCEAPAMKPAFLLLLGLAAPLPAAAAAPLLSAPAEILASDPPALRITGITPGSKVRVHALRRVTLAAANGQPERPVVVHAWADFVADRSGTVKPGDVAPLAGTWAGADPLGLMWSGWPLGDDFSLRQHGTS